MELHDCCICADGVTGPLGANANQKLLVLLALLALVFEEATNALALDHVVTHTVVHLLVGRHHMSDPA